MAPAAKEDKIVERKRKSGSGKDSTSNVTTVVGATEAKLSKTALYKEITKTEETLARERPAAEDNVLYSNTCQEMKKLLKEILDIKVKKGSKASSDIADLRVSTSLHFLTLKKLNRLDKLRTRNSRDATNAAKQRVDSLHLQLQNLLYEVLHLQKEVTKCQQFKSKDEEIDLVGVQEFYRSAPPEVSRQDETQVDEHQQRLARLEYENLQRKDMNSDFKELEKSKEALEKHIKEKKEKLASLRPQLGAILEQTKPVQEYLDMPLSKDHEQLALARFLPRCLFVLFNQVSAYGKACDKNLSAIIIGNLDEAKEFKANGGHESEDEDDDEAGDDGNEEDEPGKKKRGNHHKGSSSSSTAKSSQDERARKLIAKHPLTVQVTVSTAGGESGEQSNSVVLLFSYLHILQIVGVNVSINLSKEAKAIQGENEVLLPSTLLSHLLEPDCGTVSPNPSTGHLLKQVGLANKSGVSATSLLAEAGCLYLWAQNLAGLDFPKNFARSNDSNDAKSDADNAAEGKDENGSANSSSASAPNVVVMRQISVKEEFSEMKVGSIIKAIRNRLEFRLALQRQLSQLFKAKAISVELSIPESMQSLFPSRISSKITNWASVDWEQYTGLGVTQHLVGAGIVDGNDFFYRLQVNRDPATLIALIAVKPDYPIRAPVFCLNLHWKGEHNVHNSEHIRDLESLVNLDFSEITGSTRPEILSLQLQRLLTSLDVLLEAWNEVKNEKGGRVDFQREKIFIHAVRGRTRSLPLKYNPLLQVYSQR